MNLTTRSSLRTAVVALLLILAGVLLLVGGSHVREYWLTVFLTHLGSFVLASVALAVIWQLWQQKAFIEDMFDAARIVDQLRRAKLSGFFTTFYDGLPWDELFQHSNRLDILFAYGSTWRNAHQHHLERFLARDGARLEVVLPDPESAEIVAGMAARFDLPPEELRRRIEESADDFRRLAAGKPGHLRIYYLRRELVFTFYRFNTKAILTTYRHTTGKGPVVTFVCDRDGELYEWLRQEWYGIVKDGTAHGTTRLAFDSAGTSGPPA